MVIKAVRGDSPPFFMSDKPLAELLVRRRAELGLAEAALAEKLGVCRKTLQNWENGRTKPVSKAWSAIRSLLAVDGV
jgi:DNA-binding transcriptional regulator YiaG